jgi:hypothetical protein
MMHDKPATLGEAVQAELQAELGKNRLDGQPTGDPTKDKLVKRRGARRHPQSQAARRGMRDACVVYVDVHGLAACSSEPRP